MVSLAPAPGSTLPSIPTDPKDQRSIILEQIQEQIQGLRPLIDFPGVSYKASSEPLLRWTGKIFASYAHREIFYGKVKVTGAEAEDCFLYHRTNKPYQWWSVPPLNDYASLSIPDGVRAICSKHPQLDIDNPKFKTEYLILENSSGNGERSFVRYADVVIRAKGPFDIWREASGDEVCLIPLRNPFLDRYSNGELSWIMRRSAANGSVKEELLSFKDGWELIRHEADTSLRRRFEKIEF